MITASHIYHIMEKRHLDFKAIEEIVSQSDTSPVSDIVGLHEQIIILSRQARKSSPEGLSDDISTRQSRLALPPPQILSTNLQYLWTSGEVDYHPAMIPLL